MNTSFETDIYESATAQPKVFLINHGHLIFHDLQMEIKDLIGFTYGLRYGQGTDIIGYSEYMYQFIDASHDVVAFTMRNDPSSFQANTALHTDIEQALWFYAGDSLLNTMVRTIHDGHNVTVGTLTLNRGGVHFTVDHYMGGRQQAIPWNEAAGHVHHGTLFISSYFNRSVGTTLDLLSAYNAGIVYRILQYLTHNKYLVDVLKGNVPPLA